MLCVLYGLKEVCRRQGGKLSALAGAVDPRVKAVCLLDPVDNTVYAPEGPDYPSAVAAVRHARNPLPMAVVGCGRAARLRAQGLQLQARLVVPLSGVQGSTYCRWGLTSTCTMLPVFPRYGSRTLVLKIPPLHA